PRRPDELLLGTRTLHAVSAHIGSTVVVRLGERTVRMRVVGRGVFTESVGAGRLGEGAALTFAGMRRLAPDSIHNVVLVSVRDRSILKTLGFVRTQLSRAVAWQASALAVVAVVVGLPLGIAAGRWVWGVFAGRLGVPPRPVTPVLAVTLLVPATIVLANLVAA